MSCSLQQLQTEGNQCNLCHQKSKKQHTSPAIDRQTLFLKVHQKQSSAQLNYQDKLHFRLGERATTINQYSLYRQAHDRGYLQQGKRVSQAYNSNLSVQQLTM